MHITRRDFIRYASATAGALGLTRWQVERASQSLAAAAKPPVIWLSGSGCTGCSVSLLNAVNPTIASVLINTIDLRYHPNVMAAAGELAVSAARSTGEDAGFVLVVEGAIPTSSQGKYCYVWSEGGREVTMADAVASLAASAAHVIAVGTCASFGGIPRAYPTAGALGVGAFLGRQVVNLPGCPSHPDWIIGSLVQLLSGTAPTLDASGRPTAFYTPKVIHDRCPRRGREEADDFSQANQCLEELGCKGPSTHADCDIRGWNNGQNWCIGANGLCIGCTEPNFPAFPLHKSDESDDDVPAATPTPVASATPTPARTPAPVGGPFRSYLPSISKP